MQIFKSALQEINKRIADLQKMLHENLICMPNTIEEQKRIIRNLLNLEAPYNPAWDAVEAHSKYIHEKIKECHNEYKDLEVVLLEETSMLFQF